MGPWFRYIQTMVFPLLSWKLYSSFGSYRLILSSIPLWSHLSILFDERVLWCGCPYDRLLAHSNRFVHDVINSDQTKLLSNTCCLWAVLALVMPSLSWTWMLENEWLSRRFCISAWPYSVMCGSAVCSILILLWQTSPLLLFTGVQFPFING